MELILATPQGDLYHDEQTNILKCVWHGFVGLEMFREVVEKGTQICLDRAEPMALLLDRRELEGYSQESKDYLMNDYLKNIGKTSKGYIYKVAILPPKTFGAQTKAKIFTRIIRFAATNLPIKVFDDEYKAVEWLKIKLPGDQPEVEEELDDFESSAKKSIFKLFRSRKSRD